jgi:uncharacterized membrane protein YtjA (UPF0391 family)
MTVFGTILTVAHPAAGSALVLLMFAVLFLLSLLIRLVRGRAS